ncbi:5880_t:CDS:2 [Ambispora gerdemannii]|uniref:5880_t:CDS:1 n=1 Tax=Ambispora gerdemannii TaxID=144530 RepID=A0A9N9FCM4_9GLOM|nr:5880_t:CDS:2 [Ambispora gerdemannii]
MNRVSNDKKPYLLDYDNKVDVVYLAINHNKSKEKTKYYFRRYLYVDVRESKEYEKGDIPTSVNIPLSEFSKDFLLQIRISSMLANSIAKREL